MSVCKDEPAFPIHGALSDNQFNGMSLRDYFAAHAHPSVITAYIEANGRCIGTDHVLYNTAAIAYKMADAMLKARRET